VAEKVRAGADASEARRQARLELGDAEEARERLREGRAGFWLDSVRKDAAYALRVLRKRPAFSAVCVLTIGLGVGASTARFAVVDAVVLRPLPLPDPATLVAIYDTNPSLGVERSGVASGNLAEWRRRAQGLRGIAGYYTMGRTLTIGRAVILSRSLARRLWPDGAAVGRRLIVDYSTSGSYPYDVVGVVNDVRFGGPRTEPRQEIYLPHAQRPYLVMNVAVRSSGDPRYLAPAVREVLRDLDPRKPAHGIHSLEDLLGATYSRDRHAMLVLSAFATVAVLLSLLGIHGILSHRVRERTREIGIRMAVGADRAHLLRWIAGHGLKLTLAGVALGSALAAVSARAVSSLLFGVSLTDPAAAVAVIALPLIALVVSLHPALRATRIDAAEVLRAG